MKSKCFAILLSLIGLNSTAFTQKIAALEHTNLLNFKKEKHRDKYNYCIRPLFEKKDNNWVVYNPSDKKISFIFDDKNAPLKLTGSSTKDPLLYSVKGSKFTLDALPEYISKSFEYKDIKSTSIIADKPICPVYSDASSGVEMTQNYMHIVKNAYDKHLMNCLDIDANTIANNSEYKYVINKELRPLQNDLVLGSIELEFSNRCFSVRDSPYGRGKVHFVIYPDNTVKFLHANSVLIDIKDYDCDGNLEYVFFSATFNSYYYILYYNDFKDFVFNGYNYH